MLKKSLLVLSMFFVFSLLSLPVLAETENSTNTNNIIPDPAIADTRAKITCVASAVSVREASLGAAVSTHNEAMKAAYTTRVNELAGAYSNNTAKEVKAGTKVAWADFNKSAKAATKAWKTSRNAAWATFRASAKACKAPSGVSDSGNSGLEMNGQ